MGGGSDYHPGELFRIKAAGIGRVEEVKRLIRVIGQNRA